MLKVTSVPGYRPSVALALVVGVEINAIFSVIAGGGGAGEGCGGDDTSLSSLPNPLGGNCVGSGNGQAR